MPFNNLLYINFFFIYLQFVYYLYLYVDLGLFEER